MVPGFSCSSGYGLLIYVLAIVSMSLTIQSNNQRKPDKIVLELIKPYLFYCVVVVEIRQQVKLIRQQRLDLHKRPLKTR